MLETLKKTIFAGVGATVMSADAVKGVLADLVNKGKLSAEDAKAAFDKAAARGETDAKAFYEKASERGKKALESLPPFAAAEQIAALEKRVAALEEKLGVTPPPCACGAECSSPQEKEAPADAGSAPTAESGQ